HRHTSCHANQSVVPDRCRWSGCGALEWIGTLNVRVRPACRLNARPTASQGYAPAAPEPQRKPVRTEGWMGNARDQGMKATTRLELQPVLLTNNRGHF